MTGDDLDITYTRAIIIRAGIDDVWPSGAQLGQGRGGFYSYDGLENLVGCDIHSAGGQPGLAAPRELGDMVRLAPEFALSGASPENPVPIHK